MKHGMEKYCLRLGYAGLSWTQSCRGTFPLEPDVDRRVDLMPDIPLPWALVKPLVAPVLYFNLTCLNIVPHLQTNSTNKASLTDHTIPECYNNLTVQPRNEYNRQSKKPDMEGLRPES